MDQGYLPLDPAARVKLVGGETDSKREGLSSSQINALLRQAQSSREPARSYVIVQVLLQTELRLSECNGITFSDITVGERSGLLLVMAGKENKVGSVSLNSSAHDAIAIAVVPRLHVEEPSIKAVMKGWPTSKSAESFLPLFESQKGGDSRPQRWGR